jgi:hypothetical protein
MSKILKDMQGAGVQVHNKLEAIIRVNASDPDQACRLATEKICSDIAKERVSTRFKEISIKAKSVISVTKIRRA